MKTIRQTLRHLTAVLITATALIAASCNTQKGSDPLTRGGQYRGDSLIVYQNGSPIAKPQGAVVTISPVDGNSITLKIDSLITGFPSVTANCTTTDSKFEGTAKGSTAESFTISGTVDDQGMTLYYAPVISSSAVNKWMIAAATDSLGNTIPAISVTLSNPMYDNIEITIGGKKVKVKDLIQQVNDTLARESCYYFAWLDNFQFLKDGRCGISYDQYHAHPYIDKDTVRTFWETSLASVGTLGEFLGTGEKGILSYYITDTQIGITVPNTYIAILNTLLQTQESTLRLPVPLTVPLHYTTSGTSFELKLTKEDITLLLTAVQDICNKDYDNFLALIPSSLRDQVREYIPAATFEKYRGTIAMGIGVLLDKSTSFSINLPLSTYAPGQRPWEKTE